MKMVIGHHIFIFKYYLLLDMGDKFPGVGYHKHLNLGSQSVQTPIQFFKTFQNIIKLGLKKYSLIGKIV